MGGFPNQPRRPGPGAWIILNNPSHHQGIEEQSDGRQVLPLRRPASRMLIQPCPHVIGLYTLELELSGRTKYQESSKTRAAKCCCGTRRSRNPASLSPCASGLPGETPGPTGPTAALPQISPMGPVTTPFPRTQRRPLEPGGPAQRFAATRLRRTPQQHRTHHSGKDQSRFPLEGSSLSERDPALAQTPRAFRAALFRV